MDRISLRERRTGFLSGREGQDFFQGEGQDFSSGRERFLLERLDSFRKSHLICFLFGYLCMQTLVSLYLNFMVVLLLDCMSRDSIELN